MDITENTTVTNLLEADEFKEWCEYNHKWFEKGWINSGAASDTESYYSYIKSGQAFSFFSDYGHPLSETDQEKNCGGTDLTMVTMGEPFATSLLLCDFCRLQGSRKGNADAESDRDQYRYDEPSELGRRG